MTEGKKKENIENVKKRMAKYRNKPDFERLEINGISAILKQNFLSLPGDNYAEKLKNVVEAWKFKNLDITAGESINSAIMGTTSPPVTVSKKESPVIGDWIKFEKDFTDFLYDFKLSNQTRSKLRTQGKQIRESLNAKPIFKQSFKKICDKLPSKIVNLFKPMYGQGYFYLYERDITEIAEAKSREEMLLLLYESLRRMGKEEPVKEAKKALGI